MKVLALTRYGSSGASSRLRIVQYVPLLRGMGITVTVAPLLRENYLARLNAGLGPHWPAIFADYIARLRILFNLRQFDLVWIEKELFPSLPAWIEFLLFRAGVKYVVDYDDAIFHQYDQSVHPLKKLLRRKIDNVMRNASTVVCGNDYLAKRADAAGAHKIVIIPTVIDLRRYVPREPDSKLQCVIGWIGSPTTSKYLDMVAPALQTLAKEFSIKLVVVGAKFDLAGIQVDCLEWSEQTEVDHISTFDIGIMPLDDSPWERGKCGYKLIQYMACGRPVIASPVGVNVDLVKNDMNGYLANSTAEWLVALRKLLDSSELRCRLGHAGRRLVEEQYTLQKTVACLATTLRDAKVAS